MYLYGNSEKYLTDKNLNIGVRNYVLDSAKSVSMTGTDKANDALSINSLSKPLKQFTSEELSHVILSFNWAVSDDANGSVEIQFNDTPWDLDGQILKIDFSNAKSGRFCKKFNLATKKYYGGSINATGLAIKQDRFTGTFTVDHIKLEIGDVPTQWCPAPEDLVAKSDFDKKVNVEVPMYRHITNNYNWADILGDGNSGRKVLTSFRDDTTRDDGPTTGNFGSGIAFGGGDTKGVLSVNFGSPIARIAAGNGVDPSWHEDIAWKSDLTTKIIAQNVDINTLTNEGDFFVKSGNLDHFPAGYRNNWYFLNVVNVMVGATERRVKQTVTPDRSESGWTMTRTGTYHSDTQAVEWESWLVSDFANGKLLKTK